MNASGDKRVIKSWSRRSTIVPSGQARSRCTTACSSVYVSENMVGHSWRVRHDPYLPGHSGKKAERTGAAEGLRRLVISTAHFVISSFAAEGPAGRRPDQGKGVEEAASILQLPGPPRGRSPLLKSAIANAENRRAVDVGRLYIREICGRWPDACASGRRPWAMFRVLKRQSHVTISRHPQGLSEAVRESTVGQKTHPYGLSRPNKTWHSRWCAQRLRRPPPLGLALRSVEEAARARGVSRSTSSGGRQARSPSTPRGRASSSASGASRGCCVTIAKSTGRYVHINIRRSSVRFDAQLMSEWIAGQLERRVSFRRREEGDGERLRFGAKGVKIIAGRLGSGDRADGVVSGRAPAAAHPRRTSTTGSARRGPPTVIGVSVGVQGRPAQEGNARRRPSGRTIRC